MTKPYPLFMIPM